jgi:hypothetical protein
MGGFALGGLKQAVSNLVSGAMTVIGDLLPAASITYNLGSTSLVWLRAYVTALRDAGNNARVSISSSSANVYLGTIANSGTNTEHQFNCATSLTGSTNIAGFSSSTDTTWELAVHNSGKLIFDSTDSSGTPGAITINKPSGLVAIASGAAAVTVTNSIVTATSIVVAMLQETDGSLYVKSVVPAAGSFVINLSGNATADRTCAFVVFN